MGCLLFGYDTGITSGSMIFIREQFVLSSFWQELIVGITLVGACIFAAAAGPCSSKWGRKFVILSAAFVFTLGSIVMASAFERYQLFIGRLVCGAGIGFAATNVPTYIAEIAPIHLRGALITVAFVFIVGGQLVAAVLAGILTELFDEFVSWRYMLGIAAVPGIIQFIGFFFMPESPRWLIQKKRYDEATTVLRKIRGHDQVMTEFLDIKRECEEAELTDKSSLLEALQDKSCRKALFVGSVLWMTHELSGINTLMYYTATMIQMSGIYDKTKAVWYSAAINTLYVASTCGGVYLVEKIGRRKLLLISITGCVLSSVLIGAGFMVTEKTSPLIPMSNSMEDLSAREHLLTDVFTCSMKSSCDECTKDIHCGFCFDEKDPSSKSCTWKNMQKEGMSSLEGNCINGTLGSTVWASDWCPSSYSYIVMIGMVSFLMSFGPGLGAMAHTINAEIFPLSYRSSCVAFTTALNWAFNALISLTFLTLTEELGKPSTYWLYALLTLIGGIFMFCTMPETKGKSLEETAQLFAGKRIDEKYMN
jgi:SP family myo-inositol transporter-like MFS transporter 13